MAVMVRWVENMATVVQRDAICKSACFGLLAAGWRKYVDPTSDPTQIGVHSIYELIRQEGVQTFLWKEAGDTTVQMVRLLKKIGVPDSIIGKIVTTPPNEMTYLTISDLWEMGVDVTGHPEPPKENNGPPPPSPSPSSLLLLLAPEVFLASAVVKSRITLNSGSTILTGTVVVARDDVTWPADKPQSFISVLRVSRSRKGSPVHRELSSC